MENFKLTDFLSALFRKALPSNFRQSLYYLHPDEKLFIYDFRHDLTAPAGNTGTPIAGTGQFIIMDWTVPKSQVWVVKGFAPYAMERINAPGVTQSARYIDPQDGNGWFSFAPLTATGAPFVIQTDYNAPENIGVAGQSDRARQKSNGISQLSLSPYTDAVQQMKNPFFSMLVDSNQRFQTIFSLMGPIPVGVGLAISNPYVIGNPTPPANKRVDFAGVVVAGVMLPQAAYNEVKQLFKKEK